MDFVRRRATRLRASLGGCDGKLSNRLPVVKGWNHTSRRSTKRPLKWGTPDVSEEQGIVASWPFPDAVGLCTQAAGSGASTLKTDVMFPSSQSVAVSRAGHGRVSLATVDRWIGFNSHLLCEGKEAGDVGNPFLTAADAEIDALVDPILP